MKTATYPIQIAVTAIALCLPACASLAPREARQTVYLETTTAPKTTAYNRAMAYFAKTFKDSNHAIKMKDEAAAQIVAQGNIVCNVFRQAGDVVDYSLSFSLDFQGKDNRVRIAFEDLEMTDAHAKSVEWAYGQITDASKVEQAKVCLNPIRTDLVKAVNGGADANW